MSKRFNFNKNIVYILFALIPIGLKAQVQVTVSVNQPSCNGYTDGSATATPTGGTAPYSYAWSNGQGGQTTFGLKAADYQVTVTDATGKTASRTVTVSQPAALVAVSTATGAVCADNQSYIGSATGGTASYTFSWRNLDNGNLINGANLNNPTRGAYLLEVKDSKGCIANKTVNVNGNLNVTMRVVDVACGGMCDGAAEALVTGGAMPYTYKWNFQDKTTQSITPLPGGNYSVTVTDANGCSKVATGKVFEPDTLKPNMTVTGQCTNSATAKVAPTGGKAPYSVKWSNGATGTTVTGLTLGIYFVTVTDALGCNASAQINVSKQDPLKVMLMEKDVTCKDASIEACVPGGGLGPYTFKWSNGMSTQVIMNMGNGTYTVTVVDAAGCTDIAQITLNNANKQIKFDISATNSLCNGSTGTATAANPTGGTAPYTYKWSNGQTTAKITGISGGSYTVTVTDTIGCVATATTTVNTEGGINSIAFSKTDAACNGVANGSVTATATGTGPFNYVWNTGATTQTISNISAGTYRVTVSNSAGCSSVSEVVVGNGKTLTMTTGSSNSECSSATGSAFVSNVFGGVGPFIFRWSNGQTTQTASGLSAGTYSVTVTDAGGCQVSADNIVVKANGSNISVNITKIDASCSGIANGTVTAQAVGITPLTYKWNTGATTQSLSNIGAGTYSVTVTDAAGCIATSQITVVNSRVILLTTGTSNSNCGAATGTAFVSNIIGGVGPYNYRWSNGQTTQTATGLAVGTYSVTVSDSQGCSATASGINVAGNPVAFTVNAAITDPTCNNKNGKIVFTTTGGTAPYTYKWSGGTNTDNIGAGVYDFTITDANGCSKEETVTVNAKGAIKAAFAGVSPTFDATNTANCTADSIATKINNTTTGATASATYKWSFPVNRTSTETNPTVKLGEGTSLVQLIATSAEGCSDTFRTNIVTALPRLNVDVQDTATTCQGAPVGILAKNNNTAFPVTYKWSPDSLIVSGGTTATPSVIANGIGARKVYVTISNSIGCTKLDSVILNSVQKDALKPSDITFLQDCDTRKISFTNKSPIADQYRWVFGDTGNPTAGSTDKNPTYTYPTGGNYTVTLIPKLPCLDTVKLVVPVRNNAAVSVVANNDTSVCNATAVALRATSATAVKYEWSSNRVTFTPVLSTTNSVNITPTNPSNTYYVRATDAAGCTGVDTVVINNRALNIETDTAINACKTVDKTITIRNKNTGDTLTVVWTPPALIKGTNTGTSVTINTSNNGTLSASVKNQYGCTQSVNIPVTAREVDATASIDQNVIYVDDQVTLNSTPTGTGYTYKWNPTTDVVNANGSTTKAAPKQDTKYTVSVTDQFGCSDTASVTVKVLTPECKEPYVFIPRAFSPNVDGINDKMYVRGEYLVAEGFEFAIYNRWGELVFFTKDQSVGWDGTFKDKGVCPDVYGYYVKGKCRKGETFFKKGNITVFK